MPIHSSEPTPEAIQQAIGSERGGVPIQTIAANWIIASAAFFTPFQLIDIHVGLVERALIYMIAWGLVGLPLTNRAYRKRGAAFLSGLEQQYGPKTLREVNKRVRSVLRAPSKEKNALRFDYEMIAEQMGELQKNGVHKNHAIKTQPST